jgi:5-methyltetrahydrofolate--homocysteine methyltransferase
MLQKAGLPMGVSSERWVLENPEAVIALHRAYIEAGSEAILTNTFGGTRIKLDKIQWGDKAPEINQTAARLARQAAGDQIFVIGDIGPCSRMLEPLGDLSFADAVAAFEEQAQSLIAGGVDAILIETMSDLNEAKAAIEGAQKVLSQLPLIVTMSFDTHGRTMMGVKPKQAVKEFLALGVDVVGANCGRSLDENLQAIQEIRETAPDAILWAKPNAGLPKVSGGDVIYDVTPQIMAEYAHKFATLGVKFLGGCCGSTPDHIRAIKQALQSI